MGDLERVIKDADGDMLFALETALRRLKKLGQLDKRCDDYGRCNCPKGYCDKGLKN